jgi:hypothetical protein
MNTAAGGAAGAARFAFDATGRYEGRPRRVRAERSIDVRRLIRRLAFTLVLIAAGGWGCGDGTAPGTEEGSIEPCNQGEPSFDVWRADFAPNGRRTLLARVDTRDSAHASGFRLVVACDGEVVIDTTDGQECSDTPPGGGQCPLDAVDLGDLALQPRVECLAEVGPTEPLGLGDGDCADDARADYALRLTIDSAGLALDLVSHNCRAPRSCLQDDFDIDVDDD